MTDTPELVERLLEVVREQQQAIGAQQQAIERLTELVERTALGAGSPAEPPPGQQSGPPPTDPPKPQKQKPVDWLQVAGRDRLMVWQGLAYFVEVIVHRYNLHAEVRPCWWQHPEAVEELTALWHMRQLSYRDDADLNAAATWQDNLVKSRDRLRFMFVACLDGHVDQMFDEVWMPDEVRNEFVREVQRDVMDSTNTGR